jgi:enoyl-CoA hydratase
MMTFKNLALEQTDAVATVTICRPKVLNALNAATIQELDDCLRSVRDDTSVRAIVLTGEGDRAFIAGADITEFAGLTPTEARALARRGQALCDRLERATKPVVAAINGFALGGGLELAMACTLRVAAETAKLGQPEVNLGLLPGYGGTQRLPRLVGPGRALEMLLTGEPVDAKEAWRLGLVNRVVPADRVRDEAHELAGLLASKPPLAMQYILDAVRSGMQMSLQDGCEQEATLFGLVAATEDMREGTQAFLEKRRAKFRGQ